MTDFLSAAPAVNFGTLEAAIWIFSPVAGLRPSRALRCGDAELPETGEGHIAAALERVLNRLEHRINGVLRVLLAQPGTLSDLVDEL